MWPSTPSRAPTVGAGRRGCRPVQAQGRSIARELRVTRRGCQLGAGGAVLGLWVEQKGLHYEAVDLRVDCAEEGADLAAGQALDGRAELGHRRVLEERPDIAD